MLGILPLGGFGVKVIGTLQNSSGASLEWLKQMMRTRAFSPRFCEAMEGVSLETRQILHVFVSLGLPIREVRLTGGYTRMDLWNQWPADIFNKRVVTLEIPEASLLGAAVLAACGMGAFTSVRQAARQMVRTKKTCAPDPQRAAEYAKIYAKFLTIRKASAEGGVFAKLST